MPTEEQLAELKVRVDKAEESIKTATQELRLGERAGGDITAQRARLNENIAKLRRIKTTYNI